MNVNVDSSSLPPPPGITSNQLDNKNASIITQDRQDLVKNLNLFKIFK